MQVSHIGWKRGCNGSVTYTSLFYIIISGGIDRVCQFVKASTVLIHTISAELAGETVNGGSASEAWRLRVID